MEERTLGHTLERAKAKAEEVKIMNEYYKGAEQALILASKVVMDFDGKIFSKRIITAMNEAVSGLDGNFRFGGNSGTEGLCLYSWGFPRNHRNETLVYSFNNMMGGLSDVRTYNRATQLTDKTVVLFTLTDTGKLKINGEGWKALLYGYKDLYEDRMKIQKPFESDSIIFDRYMEKARIEKQIKELQDKMDSVVPSFIR